MPPKVPGRGGAARFAEAQASSREIAGQARAPGGAGGTGPSDRFEARQAPKPCACVLGPATGSPLGRELSNAKAASVLMVGSPRGPARCSPPCARLAAGVSGQTTARLFRPASPPPRLSALAVEHGAAEADDQPAEPAQGRHICPHRRRVRRHAAAGCSQGRRNRQRGIDAASSAAGRPRLAD